MYKPFKLAPAFKNYLWGGSKLKDEYNKKSDFDIIAESWELSAHKDGESVIATGSFAGMGFASFVAGHPQACGTKCNKSESFPILVKLIDAKGLLSVQVHPGDEYARRMEGEPGKTEMWVVLQAEEKAFIYNGFEKEITGQEMAERIAQGSLAAVLHKQYVQKGDVIFIPAGTIHAIGQGIVIAEVQQNSNSTYRVDDFGRRDAAGKARPLHVQKALDVTSLKPAGGVAKGAVPPKAFAGGSLETLAACEYFTVQRLLLAGSHNINCGEESFCALLCTQGGGSLCFGQEEISHAKGETAFVPAGFRQAVLSGKGEFILSSI